MPCARLHGLVRRAAGRRPSREMRKSSQPSEGTESVPRNVTRIFSPATRRQLGQRTAKSIQPGLDKRQTDQAQILNLGACRTNGSPAITACVTPTHEADAGDWLQPASVA